MNPWMRVLFLEVVSRLLSLDCFPDFLIEETISESLKFWLWE